MTLEFNTRSLKWLDQHLPELSFEERQSLSGTPVWNRQLRTLRATLLDDRGTAHAVLIERSKSDLMPFRRKRTPVRTRWNIELKRGRLHLGSLSIGDHRRGRHRNKVRLDITGMGCRLGFAAALCRMFIKNAVPRSLRLTRLDVALDIEAPVQNLLVFQNPTESLPKTRMARRHLTFREEGRRTGQYLGRQLVIYDGHARYRAAQDDDNIPNAFAWCLPRHVEAEGWETWTRIEVRLQPHKTASLQEALEDAVQLLGSLEVRQLDHLPAGPVGQLLGRALAIGINPHAPLTPRQVEHALPYVDRPQNRSDGRRDIWKDRRTERRRTLDIGQQALLDVLQAGVPLNNAVAIARLCREVVLRHARRGRRIEIAPLLESAADHLLQAVDPIELAKPYAGPNPWKSLELITHDGCKPQPFRAEVAQSQVPLSPRNSERSNSNASRIRPPDGDPWDAQRAGIAPRRFLENGRPGSEGTNRAKGPLPALEGFWLRKLHRVPRAGKLARRTR